MAQRRFSATVDVRIITQVPIPASLLGREPGRDQMLDMQGYLFALEALLRAHIEREERFLIPLLETAVDATASGQSR